MRRELLPVVLVELVDALDDSPSWTRFHYLDRQTGEIDTALTEEVDAAGNFADVRVDPLRHLKIEPLPAWLRLQVRERFVEQMDDPALRLDMTDALRGPQNFSEFQRLLRNHDSAFEAFAVFRLKALTEAARQWLSENKVSGVKLK